MLELVAEIEKENGTRKVSPGKVYGISSRYGQRGNEGCSRCSAEKLRMSLGYWIRGTGRREDL